MSLLQEIQSRILSLSTSYKIGGSTGSKVPIWRGTSPDGPSSLTPDTAVMMYQSGGAGAMFALGSTAATVRRPTVQVISRSSSYTTAEANAQDIYSLLTGSVNADFPITNGSTTTVRYIAVKPNQEPFDMGKDGNRRERFSCNYLIEKEPS